MAVKDHRTLAAILVACALTHASSAAAKPTLEDEPLSVLAAAEAERMALFERTADAVVLIECGKHHFGSGFFVDASGLIATNRHVAECDEKLKVLLRTGEKKSAKLVGKDKLYDLALVKISVTDLHPTVLKLADSEGARIGSYAAAVGHPVGGIWTFTDGMISNRYAAAQDQFAGIIQAQIPVQPGSSGGPVLNRGGQVVGVVTAKLGTGDNMTFCIQSNLLLRLLEEHAGEVNGQVAINGNLPGAEVWVNNTLQGSVPALVTLPVGEHRIEIRRGGKLHVKTVKLESGQVAQFSVSTADLK